MGLSGEAVIWELCLAVGGKVRYDRQKHNSQLLTAYGRGELSARGSLPMGWEKIPWEGEFTLRSDS